MLNNLAEDIPSLGCYRRRLHQAAWVQLEGKPSYLCFTTGIISCIRPLPAPAPEWSARSLRQPESATTAAAAVEKVVTAKTVAAQAVAAAAVAQRHEAALGLLCLARTASGDDGPTAAGDPPGTKPASPAGPSPEEGLAAVPFRFTEQERAAFFAALRVHGRNWAALHAAVPSRTTDQLKNFYNNHRKRLQLDDIIASRSYLKELYIQDFALVAKEHVVFQPGLNVVTGESGSGKSVLVEALQQVLGAPASEECLRPPATAAVLEGTLEVAPVDCTALAALLRQLGVPQRAIRSGPGPLTLRREIVKVADGVRSRCSVNGSPTSLRVLREVGRLLVDINGQHAALSLRDGSTQLVLLDRIAGTTAVAAQLADTLSAWQAAQAQLHSLDELADEAERESMQALVVAAVGLEPGEDMRLRRRLRQLDARRSAAERCRLVSTALDDPATGAGVLGALRDVEGHLRGILSQEARLQAQAEAELEEARRARTGGTAAASSENDFTDGDGVGSRQGLEEDDDGDLGRPSVELLEQAMALLDQAREVLGEAEGAVEQWARQYRFSQAEYDEASSRLQQVERLLRQHDAASADELLSMAAARESALDEYFQLEGRREELESAAAELQAAARGQALALSAARRAAAGRLRHAVEGVLSSLAMGGARFEVRIAWAPAEQARGGTGGARDTTSLEVGPDDAAACWEAPGRYRVRLGGGLDWAEYLCAAGPAEPLHPLAAVASGGESARIMLALKAAPALAAAAVEATRAGAGAGGGSDVGGGGAAAAAAAGGASGSPLLVLDEIDSGVGNRLGQPVGRLLRQMAASSVAAHAANHLCVRKQELADGGGRRLVTRFESLAGREERLAEIQAMLGLPRPAAEENLTADAHTCPATPTPQQCSWRTVLSKGQLPQEEDRPQVLPDVTCPVCGHTTGTLLFADANLREGGACPVCGASNRERQANRLLNSSLESVVQLGETSLHILALECRGAIQDKLRNATGFECRRGRNEVAVQQVLLSEGTVRLELLESPASAALECLYRKLSRQRYDLVFSSDLLEHVPSPYHLFDASLAWLRPGGAHVFTVPWLTTQRHPHYLHTDGALVYTLFGPSMVDKLCALGWLPAAYRLHDKAAGIIGSNAWVFLARRPPCGAAR
eukprot:scaffold1.g5825.t1